MTLLVILTLIAVGLLVVALALVLIAILLRLRTILFTLGTVNVGLRAIARRVEPLEPVLADVNSDLSAANHAMSDALGSNHERGKEVV
jgi:Zn-dependent membrane protease YugP